MKKTLLLCSLLLLPGQVQASTPPASSAGTLDWSVARNWKLAARPLDFVQSLDNKMVFVLGDDAKVYIYSVNGARMGEIEVAESTTGIDISPRGEQLYLVDSDKNYTAINIAFTKDIDISGSPFLGKENAPVTMVVFSDFQ